MVGLVHIVELAISLYHFYLRRLHTE